MPDYKRLIKRKIPARKIGQKGIRPKNFLSKTILPFMLVLLIFTATLGARSLLSRSPNFNIKEVSVINQEGELVSNPQDFFRSDLLGEDFNLFNFDMKRVVQDIQARHPELERVLIHKQFPSKLLIVIKEKKPVAKIVLQDFYLVDAEGFILPFKSIYRDLPNVIGIHPKQIKLYAKSQSLRLKKALGLLRELKNAKIYPEYKVSQIDVSRYSDIVFYLENRLKVKMGQSGFKRKAIILSQILTQLKVNDVMPKYIDMRFDSPVVKP